MGWLYSIVVLIVFFTVYTPGNTLSQAIIYSVFWPVFVLKWIIFTAIPDLVKTFWKEIKK